MSTISDDGLWRLVDGKWIPNQQQGAPQTSEDVSVDLSDSRTITVECPSCGAELWGVKKNYSGTLGCKSCDFHFESTDSFTTRISIQQFLKIVFDFVIIDFNMLFLDEPMHNIPCFVNKTYSRSPMFDLILES